MRIFKGVMTAIVFALAHTAVAGTLYETATIKSVDAENNTITVEFEKSGLTKTFNFPEKIGFVDEGIALVDKSAFKPGQSVSLELESEKPKAADYGITTRKEYSLKGMTVR
jgi:hypothetical protein